MLKVILQRILRSINLTKGDFCGKQWCISSWRVEDLNFFSSWGIQKGAWQSEGLRLLSKMVSTPLVTHDYGFQTSYILHFSFHHYYVHYVNGKIKKQKLYLQVLLILLKIKFGLTKLMCPKLVYFCQKQLLLTLSM